MSYLRETEDDESFIKNPPIIHYRFKRKLDFLNCHIQLYISEDKLKIVINCIEDYSQNMIEYSNYFSFSQLRGLNNYFGIFRKLEDILEDMANILQYNNYDIERNSNSLTLILHVAVNDEFGDVHLTLFRNKVIINNNNKSSKIVQTMRSNNDNRKKLINKPRKDYCDTDNSAANNTYGVKSVRELNNVLTDLKDRVTVLEVTQNSSPKKDNYNKSPIGNNSLADEDNILLNMDSIIKRINRLEEANTQKKEKIKFLEERLKQYEPFLTTTTDIDRENASGYPDNNKYYNEADYISLGTLTNKNNNNKNVSINSVRKSNLLIIDEENNYSSSNDDDNNHKNKSRRHGGSSTKNYNVHSLEKKKRNKSTEVEKKKDKNRKTKNKRKEMNSHSRNKDNNKDRNKDNNESNNYRDIEDLDKMRKRKAAMKMAKRDRDKKTSSQNEEMICTDYPKKNRKHKNKTIVQQYDENESLRIIQNLENHLDKKKPNIIVREGEYTKDQMFDYNDKTPSFRKNLYDNNKQKNSNNIDNNVAYMKHLNTNSTNSENYYDGNNNNYSNNYYNDNSNNYHKSNYSNLNNNNSHNAQNITSVKNSMNDKRQNAYNNNKSNNSFKNYNNENTQTLYNKSNDSTKNYNNDNTQKIYNKSINSFSNTNNYNNNNSKYRNNNNNSINDYNYDNSQNIYNNANSTNYNNNRDNPNINNENMNNQNQFINTNNDMEKKETDRNEKGLTSTRQMIKESTDNYEETKKTENNMMIKLPLIEKEDLQKYVDSEIIFTKNELKLLKTKINGGIKNIHVFFDILYRATEDGDNTSAIKKLVKDKFRTLTLFYSQEGARFGIYVEKEIYGKTLKERKGSCFLVSLNNLATYDILDNKYATDNKGDMLCFIRNQENNRNGSGWAIFTPPKQFLGKECILGEIRGFFDVDYLEKIIGEKYEYHLKEVEIFEVAIEEEERNNNNEIKNTNNLDLGNNMNKRNDEENNRQINNFGNINQDNNNNLDNNYNNNNMDNNYNYNDNDMQNNMENNNLNNMENNNNYNNNMGNNNMDNNNNYNYNVDNKNNNMDNNNNYNNNLDNDNNYNNNMDNNMNYNNNIDNTNNNNYANMDNNNMENNNNYNNMDNNNNYNNNLGNNNMENNNNMGNNNMDNNNNNYNDNLGKNNDYYNNNNMDNNNMDNNNMDNNNNNYNDNLGNNNDYYNNNMDNNNNNNAGNNNDYYNDNNNNMDYNNNYDNYNNNDVNNNKNMNNPGGNKEEFFLSGIIEGTKKK